MTIRSVTACAGICVLGAALSGCTTKVDESDIRFISSGELRQMIQTRDGGRADHLLLIDPRSAREYAEGHIVGAEHITIDRVVGEKSPRNPPFDRYSHVVVYGNDPASAPARGMAKRIMSLGHKKTTRMYAGGMKEWSQTYPSMVVKGEEPAK
ncbi:MAG: rhodanese-like domain-containing protein [Phycisphaeraceae bacterium]|nr:MAG: rhodanese-like domain-containing protein [Phycisphaeraceae bacterium]